MYIHHTERGQGDPLVLIMGLSADGTLWEKHVQAYSQHFRCIMVDNRGAGKSDAPPGPYTTTQMADDTAALMDRLGISCAHIAGISMGGAISQELALRHPAKVRSLTLVCTWARCLAYTQDVFRMLADSYRALPPAEMTRLLQLWIYAPDFYTKNAAELQKAAAEASSAGRMTADALKSQSDGCISHNTLDRLHNIQVPTLVTSGDMDIFTPLSYSQEIVDRIPGAELAVFARMGHAHHWEGLEEFNRRTLEFMKGVR